MPSGMVLAMADQLPRLQATESLSLIQAHAAGSGSMKKPQLESYLRSLVKKINRGKRQKGIPVDRSALADIGIDSEEGG